MIVNSIETFEDYHRAIYRLEITRRLFSCNAIDLNHNAVIAQVSFLNRLAKEASLPPFYDGIVSEDKPYRREVANAVLE